MLVFGNELLFWRRLDITAPSETGIKAAARELADTRMVKMVQRMNLVLIVDIMLARFLFWMMIAWIAMCYCHREASQVMIEKTA